MNQAKRRPDPSIRASSFCDRTKTGLWLVLWDAEAKRILVVPLRAIHEDAKLVMVEHGVGPLWYLFDSVDEANRFAIESAKEEGWEAVEAPTFPKS